LGASGGLEPLTNGLKGQRPENAYTVQKLTCFATGFLYIANLKQALPEIVYTYGYK